MKRIQKYSYGLTLLDVQQSVNNGWQVSVYKKRLCLENEKTIFVPNFMPKP